MTTRLHRQLMKSPIARTGVGCLSVLSFLLALIVGFAMCSRFLHARATGQWTQATGKVEKVAVDETVIGGQTQYVPSVAYRFTHEGQSFIGTQIEPQEQTFSSSAAAAESVATLKVGAELPVYYDPANPRRSVLRPGAQRKDYLLLGLPLLFLFFAYGFFRIHRRSKPEPQEDND